MRYVLRNESYYKRRDPTGHDIVSVKPHLPIDTLVDNYRCTMVGSNREDHVVLLTARVNHNEIKDTWAMHCTGPNRISLMVDIYPD